MIDILIIEDDLKKYEAIKKVITEIVVLNTEFILHSENILSAKKHLEKIRFDILIMDLVIPYRNGDNPDPKYCCELIEEFETSPFLKSPMFIIGLTKFDNLTETYSDLFEKRLYHLLQYEESSLDWQSKLRRIIFHIVKLKKDFLSPDELKYQFDAVFISALYDPEFKAILDLSNNWNKINHNDDPTTYYETTIEENGKFKRILAACADQMGMVACASLTTKILLKFKPEYIFLVGITAGVRKSNFNYGDILVADLFWDYNSGKIVRFKVEDKNGEQTFSDTVFEVDPKSINIKGMIKSKLLESVNNNDLLYSIKKEWKGVRVLNELQAFLGPLASGSQVVASSSKMAEIKLQNRKLIGIEMEAYGLMYACTQIFESKITPIVVKSICDFGDEDKDDTYQNYAAFTSVQFAKNLLFEYF